MNSQFERIERGQNAHTDTTLRRELNYIYDCLQNNCPVRELPRTIQDNVVFTNDRVAAYTFVDAEVRGGIRRLFAGLRSLLAGRRLEAADQATVTPVERPAEAQ